MAGSGSIPLDQVTNILRHMKPLIKFDVAKCLGESEATLHRCINPDTYIKDISAGGKCRAKVNDMTVKKLGGKFKDYCE